MVNLVMRWVISAVALGVVAHVPGLGISYGNDISVLLKATIFIGLMNAFVKPILKLLTLPLNCLTFGLFGFVLNAAMFYSTTLFVKGFHVGLLGAIVGPMLMGLVSGILASLLPDKD